jgi:hypothetical protein
LYGIITQLKELKTFEKKFLIYLSDDLFLSDFSILLKLNILVNSSILCILKDISQS